VGREKPLWVVDYKREGRSWARFSPDGRALAILAEDDFEREDLRLYEAATGRLVGSLRRPGGVGRWASRSLVFSPDGLTLLVWCSYVYGDVVPEHGVIVWRSRDGEWQWAGPLQGASTHSADFLFSASPCHAAFSPDGRWIAVVDGDGVRIHRAADGSVVHHISPGVDEVTSVAFNPADGALAVGGRSGKEGAVSPGSVTLWKLGIMREPEVRE
jgi:WD40 repeat protein